MKIYLATDHAGFQLKEDLKMYLQQEGHAVEDCGAYHFDPDDDYPDFVADAAKKMALDPQSFGVILGKSGAGECIVANKVNGIRAVLGVTPENVTLARQHNDANVLSLGLILVSVDTAKQLVDLFLKTPFSGEERHKRRVDKIKDLEEGVTEM